MGRGWRVGVGLGVVAVAALGAAVVGPRVLASGPGTLAAPGPSIEAVQEQPAIAAGTWFVEAPSVAPGLADRGPTPDLDAVRRHLIDGDADRALRDARRIADEKRWGRERTLANMVLGFLYRERGLHNLASEAFTQVRSTKGPLAEWGAYYEAEQDYERGKPWVAVRECNKVRERWAEGRFDAACQRLQARALVRAGQTARAREAADAHDEAFEDNPIREQIDLAIARRWAVPHPDLAIPLLRKLAVEHSAPLTGRVAEGVLAELNAAGRADAVLPDDVSSLKARAISLRDSKRKPEARDAFAALRVRAADDPALRDWVEGEAARFYWRTHDWPRLVEHYAASYAESGDPDDAWSHYKALTRGGRYTEALTAALAAQESHGRAQRWRRSQEVVGRTAMLARDYTAAKSQFDVVAKRGGWAGRRAQLFAGFSAHMNGEHDDAVTRLTALIDRNRGYVPNARYWRAAAHEALGQADLAKADRDWLLENAPLDWYAMLVRQRGQEPLGPPWDRSGRWSGPAPPTLPEVPTHDRVAAVPVATPVAQRVFEARQSPWAALTWPLQAAGAPAAAVPAPTPSDAFRDPLAPPHSYRESAFYDEADARKALAKAARRNGGDWPDWIVARDLADAGLYDLSGPVMSGIHEEWREAWRSPRHPRHAAARKISARNEDWRPLFYATRDHHHTDRFTFGLWDKVTDPEQRKAALRLGWPLAHDRYVWSHAREHDVDPFLVMAIMRVESRYDAIAVSRVGARGAMQIMPRTGALIANQLGDEDFLTGDLEDPVFSVGYGITYLGQLLDRFDGAFPMAVASYNGGPFAVHSWLKGTGPDMPMDAFVEHIPYKETRRYTRSVSAAYQTYLDLYADEGTQLALPHGPYSSDPGVVDF